jgi:hypothetical protein
MPESQQVVEHPTSAAVFLVLTVAAGREDDVRDVLAGAGGRAVRSASGSRRHA